MYDVIVIGGGPAALSATTFLQQKNVNSLMVYEELGGKASWVHNRLSDGSMMRLPGHDIVANLIQRITAPDSRVHHVYDRVINLRRDNNHFAVTCQREGEFQSLAVIVATGTTPQKLELPGIQHLLGSGLGYSITTYAHQVKNKQVAVVGITPRTVRGIAEILHSASHIYIIAEDDVLPNVPLFHTIQQSPNVQLLLNTKVHEVIGISSVKRLVVERDGNLEQLNVDRIFVDLGLNPNTEFLRDLHITDKRGFMIVDEYNSGLSSGIFAAGDVSTGVMGEQILVAVGDGARAALSAYEYMLVAKLTHAIH